VCDVYDALISSRPYRPKNYDNRTALEELTAIANAGGLDWRCIKALIGRNRAGQPTPDKVDISLEKRGTPPSGNCYAVIAE
jgi:HD-GYP domain-containing protein (c-di-GMP phosphodiesterase class II)